MKEMAKHEKSATRKLYNMEMLKHEKNATKQKCNSKK